MADVFCPTVKMIKKGIYRRLADSESENPGNTDAAIRRSFPGFDATKVILRIFRFDRVFG